MSQTIRIQSIQDEALSPRESFGKWQRESDKVLIPSHEIAKPSTR